MDGGGDDRNRKRLVNAILANMQSHDARATNMIALNHQITFNGIVALALGRCNIRYPNLTKQFQEDWAQHNGPKALVLKEFIAILKELQLPSHQFNALSAQFDNEYGSGHTNHYFS